MIFERFLFDQTIRFTIRDGFGDLRNSVSSFLIAFQARSEFEVGITLNLRVGSIWGKCDFWFWVGKEWRWAFLWGRGWEGSQKIDSSFWEISLRGGLIWQILQKLQISLVKCADLTVFLTKESKCRNKFMYWANFTGNYFSCRIKREIDWRVG